MAVTSLQKFALVGWLAGWTIPAPGGGAIAKGDQQQFVGGLQTPLVDSVDVDTPANLALMGWLQSWSMPPGGDAISEGDQQQFKYGLQSPLYSAATGTPTGGRKAAGISEGEPEGPATRLLAHRLPDGRLVPFVRTDAQGRKRPVGDGCRDVCCDGGECYRRADLCPVVDDDCPAPPGNIPPIYFPCTATCDDGDGGGVQLDPGIVFKHDGRCWTVADARFTLATIPLDAEVFDEAFRPDCVSDCLDPACFPRWIIGTPCDPDAVPSGTYAIRACLLTRCIVASIGGCTKFDPSSTPVDDLPPGVIPIQPPPVSFADCCACVGSFNADAGCRHYRVRSEPCRDPDATAGPCCCTPDDEVVVDGFAVAGNFERVTTTAGGDETTFRITDRYTVGTFGQNCVSGTWRRVTRIITRRADGSIIDQGDLIDDIPFEACGLNACPPLDADRIGDAPRVDFFDPAFGYNGLDFFTACQAGGFLEQPAGPNQTGTESLTVRLLGDCNRGSLLASSRLSYDETHPDGSSERQSSSWRVTWRARRVQSPDNAKCHNGCGSAPVGRSTAADLGSGLGGLL